MSKSFLLPEWTQCRAILLAWPFLGGDWDANFEEVEACYWQMIEAFAAKAEVWILLHSSIDIKTFNNRLTKIDGQYPILTRADVHYDHTWIRDFGPLTLNDGFASFIFNGWGGKYYAEADNCVAGKLENWLGGRPHRVNLVCEGGGLEINDNHVLLANEDCLIDSARNLGKSKDYVQEKLREALGVREFAWLSGVCLTGDDTDGHIDTIARFGPSNVIVYSGRNKNHHDSSTLESLHEQVTALANRWGWTCFELPTPIVKSRVNNSWLPASYTNFLICNKAVFQPIYGADEDHAALEIIASAFPEFEIISVDCSALVEQYGSLHCATMQVAKNRLS
jgi:agmatine/peptidylarginine deiminase